MKDITWEFAGFDASVTRVSERRLLMSSDNRSLISAVRNFQNTIVSSGPRLVQYEIKLHSVMHNVP